MMTTFKIASLGVVDSQGDIFMPGCVKQDKALLLDEFKNELPMGDVYVFESGLGLFATADIPESHFGKYPAIGFTTVSVEKEKGTRIINEIKLYAVGLCVSPNIDETINPIHP